MAVVNWKLMEMSGDDAGSDLLMGDDAKTEMIEKVKIVVMPGGKVEMRLGLEC